MLKILEELIAILRLQSTITGKAVMDATARHLADDAAYCAICDDKPSTSRKISITQFNWSKTHRHRTLQQLSPVHLTNHAVAQNAEWLSVTLIDENLPGIRIPLLQPWMRAT